MSANIAMADDPTRVMKDVTHPATEPLPTNELFNSDGLISLDALKDHFYREGRLHKKDALEILRKASEILRGEDNVLSVKSPITSIYQFIVEKKKTGTISNFSPLLLVCGDTHGQLYDLFKLFEVGGNPAETNYLFLGDYVDRGYFSCETYLYLLAHKINYPDSFFMLRGNHECRHLTACFTLKEECKSLFF